MDWPANCPVLNPIEHIWDELDRRTYRINPPQTLNDLRNRLTEHSPGNHQTLYWKHERGMSSRAYIWYNVDIVAFILFVEIYKNISVAKPFLSNIYNECRQYLEMDFEFCIYHRFKKRPI